MSSNPVDVMAYDALYLVFVKAVVLGKAEWANGLWGRPGKRGRCLSATASATVSLQAA